MASGRRVCVVVSQCLTRAGAAGVGAIKCFTECCELNRLIRFRFRAAVLVRNLIFFEEIRHFFGHDGIVILNGKHRELPSHLGLLV